MPKRKLFICSLTLLTAILATSVFVSANVTVGVKKGDWIEYQVSVSGIAPEGHDAKWARMEVSNVQGSALTLNVTTQFTNGSYLYENITLNLQTGELGDDFFIPSNMNLGQNFTDIHSGNITISKSEEKIYAGTSRPVLYGATAFTTFYWDKQTGILVEANSNYKDINFTMTTIAYKTNIWQPQNSIQGISYFLIIVILLLVITALIAIWRRKKPK